MPVPARGLALVALVSACGYPECPPDMLRNQYGECVAPDPDRKAPLPEGGESLPPCERLNEGSQIDLINGCVEGACVDDTYAEINAALGEVGDCDEYDFGVAFCEWRGGAIQANFEDDNNDGIPDAGDIAYGLYLYEPYSGSSAGGLGVGVSLRCFLEDFIAINDIETNEVDGETQIVEVFFDNPSMFVHDDYVAGDYDGYVSWISMFGP